MAANALPASSAPGALGPRAEPTLRFFLADVHLDGQLTPRAKVFRALLERAAEEAKRRPVETYFLGDLFEFWDEYHRQALAPYEDDLAALESAHQAGVKIALLSGNRDFLYGRYARKRFGAVLLGDGGMVQLSDTRFVWLEHGDLVCTGDRRYLRYRRWVRSCPARLVYWLLPWSLARILRRRVAAQSQADCEKKDPQEFEPDLDFARKRLESKGCQVLLMGHTHQPQAADLGAGYRLLVAPAFCETLAGYKEFGGAIAPVKFREDGAFEG
jgi:UDP-2,3-diacylglucosamine hydrolase